MHNRRPLCPEVLPRLMRQSLLLSGDALNSHFHLAKTQFEPAVDLIIAAGEQEKWCCSLDKSPTSNKNPSILKSPSEACPTSLFKTAAEEIQDKTITTLSSILKCKLKKMQVLCHILPGWSKAYKKHLPGLSTKLLISTLLTRVNDLEATLILTAFHNHRWF